jgi:hypothetical protein
MVISRGNSIFLETLGDEVHSFRIATIRSQNPAAPGQFFCPPAILLQGVLENELYGSSRHLQKLWILSKAVIQETVNPDRACQEPEVFLRVHKGAVIIQAAHDSAVFVVDSVLVPKGKENVEEPVMELVSQIRKAHACQPDLGRGSGGAARLSHTLRGTIVCGLRLDCRFGQFDKFPAFHVMSTIGFRRLGDVPRQRDREEDLSKDDLIVFLL